MMVSLSSVHALRLRWLIALAVLVAGTLASASARADGEAWIWLENRVPVVRADRPTFPRTDWRTLADFRLNTRSSGLQQAFFRTGPLFFLTDFLFVGAHGTIYADRLPTGAFDQEARLELEPNLFWRLGDFTFNERNRGEYRWRESGVRWRYRNQIRVNYAPIGARWIPFFWDELLVDLSGLGVNQNRAQLGLGRMINRTTRVDLGYMVRSREDLDGRWSHDHVLNLYVLFDVVPP